MTSSPIRIRPAAPGDHETLRNLWLLFRHDMSPYSGELPDERGRFRDTRLRTALGGDPDWRALLFTGDRGAPVGFALLRAMTGPVRVINSFFVVAAARRGGLGRRIVPELLASYPGRWEVAFQESNRAGAAFWRAVAVDIAGHGWHEEVRTVPGLPDDPPDHWIGFTVGGEGGRGTSYGADRRRSPPYDVPPGRAGRASPGAAVRCSCTREGRVLDMRLALVG
jgi:predicted acetyltransferase